MHLVPTHPKLKPAAYYTLGRAPVLTAAHNKASWNVIKAILDAYGGACYADLCAAVSQHDYPVGGGSGFVVYCIQRGWLVEH